jgi:hypothetical protein
MITSGRRRRSRRRRRRRRRSDRPSECTTRITGSEQKIYCSEDSQAVSTHSGEVIAGQNWYSKPHIVTRIKVRGL